MLRESNNILYQADTDDTLIAFLNNVKGTEYRYRFYMDLPGRVTFDEGCVYGEGWWVSRHAMCLSTYHGNSPRMLMLNAWDHVVGVVPSSISAQKKKHPGWIIPEFDQWLKKNWACDDSYTLHLLGKWLPKGENIWQGHSKQI